MAHGLNSSKTPARPAHQAIEKASDNSIGSFKSEHRRLDNLAMRWAKRAQNRLIANEHRDPGNTLFSK
ncbi:MAG: hypothetical protein ABSG84_00815 [Acidobacteriaceae bacterium]|jgi:hypothetical protein